MSTDIVLKLAELDFLPLEGAHLYNIWGRPCVCEWVCLRSGVTVVLKPVCIFDMSAVSPPHPPSSLEPLCFPSCIVRQIKRSALKHKTPGGDPLNDSFSLAGQWGDSRGRHTADIRMGKLYHRQANMLKYVPLSGQSRERDKLRFISLLLLI